MLCHIDGWRELDDDRPQTCRPCEWRIHRWLDYLAAAIPLLQLLVRTEPTRTGELDLGAMDLILPARTVYAGDDDDRTGPVPIASVLGTWFEAWSGREIVRVDALGMIEAIRRSIRWACRESPHITAFAEQLRQLFAAARRALDRDLRGERRAAPCPSCGEQTLTRPVGADWIECRPCDLMFDEHEYVARSLDRIPNGALLYGHEAALICGISINAVEQHASRGRLARAVPDESGRPRYLRGDVVQLRHELGLWRDNVAELHLWTGSRRDGQTSIALHLVAAGTTVEVGGVRVRCGRGKVVSIGPVDAAGPVTMWRPVPRPAAVTRELVAA